MSPSYVEDVAAATVSLLRAAPAQGLYHCVGSGHATWFGVTRELAERLDVQPVMDGDRVHDMKVRVLPYGGY